jgi:hypothetical protein
VKQKSFIETSRSHSRFFGALAAFALVVCAIGVADAQGSRGKGWRPYPIGPYDPNAGSRQLLTFVNAQHEGAQGTIENRLIDGLEARLLRNTYKNAGFINHRDVLVIYSADRFWVIDAVAAENEKDQIARVIDSASVELPVPSTVWRQHLGNLHMSFNFGAEQIKPSFKESPDDPDIVHEENALANFDGGLLGFLEDTTRAKSSEWDEPKLTGIAQSFLSGLGESLKTKLTVTLRDSYPITVDGTDGMHLLYDVTAAGGDKTFLCDFVVFTQDKLFWSVIVLTDVKNEMARTVRARIVNTLHRS